MLPADAARELHVLGHDSDALGVDGAQICVFEQTNEVRLGRLLQCDDGGRLKAEVMVVLLCDLPHEPREGQFLDQQCARLLIRSDLAQRNHARAITILLLAATHSLGREGVANTHREGFAMPLATGVPARRMLGARHSRV